MNSVLDQIRHRMLVSCQGYDERTFHTAEDMLAMANAAYLGGCAGFRLNSPEYVKLIKKHFPDMPVIGIWKRVTEGCDVYITPDMESVLSLRDAGADIVALDATLQKNHLGMYGYETIRQVKEEYPDIILMADCSTFEEAEKACGAGADIVSTTMSGYTPYSGYREGPDYEMLKKCREQLSCFVICEGRIWSREDAVCCFNSGADAIVVGTAITNPKLITERFVSYLKEVDIWQS